MDKDGPSALGDDARGLAVYVHRGRTAVEAVDRAVGRAAASRKVWRVDGDERGARVHGHVKISGKIVVERRRADPNARVRLERLLDGRRQAGG